MGVALPPELEELITEQVESGSYPSPGEVVRDALRLFKEVAGFEAEKAGEAADPAQEVGSAARVPSSP